MTDRPIEQVSPANQAASSYINRPLDKLRYEPFTLRCFDTFFLETIPKFFNHLKVILSLSDRYEIFTTD